MKLFDRLFVCRRIFISIVMLCLISCNKPQRNSNLKDDNPKFHKELVNIAGYETNVFLPTNYDQKKSYKTLLLLHGALIPNAIDFLTLFSFQNYVDSEQFIILAPHINNPVTLWAWNLTDVKTELDKILDAARSINASSDLKFSGGSIDYDQLYLTGYSGGARAAFMYVNHQSPKYMMKGMIIFGGDGVGGSLIGSDYLRYSKPAYPLSLKHVQAEGDYMVPTQRGIATYESFTENLCEGLSDKKNFSDDVVVIEGINCKDQIQTSLYHVMKVNNPVNPHAIDVNSYGLVEVILQDLFK